MRQQAIDELLSLAYEAYTTNQPADKFACNAASKAASETAKKHSNECADAAALIGALEQLKSSSLATQFSANVTDSANLKLAHDRSLNATRVTFSHRKTPIRKNTEISYADITDEINRQINIAEDQIHLNYQASFSQDAKVNQKAKRAAIYTYAHAYSCSRTAYVLASFQANQTLNPSKREKIFKSYISERLNHDLTYDQIQPSLLLKIMCSTPLCIIAGLLIIGGTTVIVCATLGIGSIPFAIGIAAGSTAAAAGTGLSIGSFFAKRERKKIAEINERMEETNTFF